MDEPIDNIAIYWLDDMGWSTLISDDCEPGSMRILDIKENDSIQLRKRFTDSVGAKFPLINLAYSNSFNESIAKRVSTLSDEYSGFRKIRGDGNCYYRAIGYGLLEQLVNSGSSTSLTMLYNIFRKIRLDYLSNLTLHYEFLKALKNPPWHDVVELESEFLQSDRQLDTALVQACRALLAEALVDNEKMEFNGISLRDAILIAHEKYSDLKAYCLDQVQAMDVSAEGPFVEMGLLPQLLHCTCTLVLLSRDATTEVKILRTDVRESDRDSVIGDLHILLQPGHYDLLYQRDSDWQLIDNITTTITAADAQVDCQLVADGIRSASTVKEDQLVIQREEFVMVPASAIEPNDDNSNTPTTTFLDDEEIVLIDSEDSHHSPLSSVEPISSRSVESLENIDVDCERQVPLQKYGEPELSPNDLEENECSRLSEILNVSARKAKKLLRLWGDAELAIHFYLREEPSFPLVEQQEDYSQQQKEKSDGGSDDLPNSRECRSSSSPEGVEYVNKSFLESHHPLDSVSGEMIREDDASFFSGSRDVVPNVILSQPHPAIRKFSSRVDREVDSDDYELLEDAFARFAFLSDPKTVECIRVAILCDYPVKNILHVVTTVDDRSISSVLACLSGRDLSKPGDRIRSLQPDSRTSRHLDSLHFVSGTSQGQSMEHDIKQDDFLYGGFVNRESLLSTSDKKESLFDKELFLRDEAIFPKIGRYAAVIEMAVELGVPQAIATSCVQVKDCCTLRSIYYYHRMISIGHHKNCFSPKSVKQGDEKTYKLVEYLMSLGYEKRTAADAVIMWHCEDEDAALQVLEEEEGLQYEDERFSVSALYGSEPDTHSVRPPIDSHLSSTARSTPVPTRSYVGTSSNYTLAMKLRRDLRARCRQLGLRIREDATILQLKDELERYTKPKKSDLNVKPAFKFK